MNDGSSYLSRQLQNLGSSIVGGAEHLYKYDAQRRSDDAVYAITQRIEMFNQQRQSDPDWMDTNPVAPPSFASWVTETHPEALQATDAGVTEQLKDEYVQTFTQANGEMGIAGTERRGFLSKWKDEKDSIRGMIDAIPNPLAKKEVESYFRKMDLNQTVKLMDYQREKGNEERLSLEVKKYDSILKNPTIPDEYKIGMIKSGLLGMANVNIIPRQKADELVGMYADSIMTGNLANTAIAAFEKGDEVAALEALEAAPGTYVWAGESFTANTDVRKNAKIQLVEHMNTVYERGEVYLTGLYQKGFDPATNPDGSLTVSSIEYSKLPPERRRYYLSLLYANRGMTLSINDAKEKSSGQMNAVISKLQDGVYTTNTAMREIQKIEDETNALFPDNYPASEMKNAIWNKYFLDKKPEAVKLLVGDLEQRISRGLYNAESFDKIKGDNLGRAQYINSTLNSFVEEKTRFMGVNPSQGQIDNLNTELNDLLGNTFMKEYAQGKAGGIKTNIVDDVFYKSDPVRAVDRFLRSVKDIDAAVTFDVKQQRFILTPQLKENFKTAFSEITKDLKNRGVLIKEGPLSFARDPNEIADEVPLLIVTLEDGKQYAYDPGERPEDASYYRYNEIKGSFTIDRTQKMTLPLRPEEKKKEEEKKVDAARAKQVSAKAEQITRESRGGLTPSQATEAAKQALAAEQEAKAKANLPKGIPQTFQTGLPEASRVRAWAMLTAEQQVIAWGKK